MCTMNERGKVDQTLFSHRLILDIIKLASLQFEAMFYFGGTSDKRDWKWQKKGNILCWMSKQWVLKRELNIVLDFYTSLLKHNLFFLI